MSSTRSSFLDRP